MFTFVNMSVAPDKAPQLLLAAVSILKDRGWTHERIAERIGVTKGAVSKYLSQGAVSAPDSNALLAAIFAVEPSTEDHLLAALGLSGRSRHAVAESSDAELYRLRSENERLREKVAAVLADNDKLREMLDRIHAAVGFPLTKKPRSNKPVAKRK